MAELKNLKNVQKIQKVEKLDAVGQQIAFLKKLTTDKTLAKKFVAEPEKIARENGIEKLDTDITKAIVENVVSNIPFTEKVRTVIGEKNMKSIESLKVESLACSDVVENVVEKVVHVLRTYVISLFSTTGAKLDDRKIAKSPVNKVTKLK